MSAMRKIAQIQLFPVLFPSDFGSSGICSTSYRTAQKTPKNIDVYDTRHVRAHL